MGPAAADAEKWRVGTEQRVVACRGVQSETDAGASAEAGDETTVRRATLTALRFAANRAAAFAMSLRCMIVWRRRKEGDAICRSSSSSKAALCQRLIASLTRCPAVACRQGSSAYDRMHPHSATHVRRALCCFALPGRSRGERGTGTRGRQRAHGRRRGTARSRRESCDVTRGTRAAWTHRRSRGAGASTVVVSRVCPPSFVVAPCTHESSPPRSLVRSSTAQRRAACSLHRFRALRVLRSHSLPSHSGCSIRRVESCTTRLLPFAQLPTRSEQAGRCRPLCSSLRLHRREC